ncbi:hypothetical protein ENSA5_51520 [Enhygromyxa salina]|uniref:Uncharacterized protein n=1 Tax=Enhygromyxa salina TaxID=215803 RepID=A0A2S9XGY6_9BACT|nr:hypothetical protein [Enhygromyxa salina]PRP92112.1 hypothetical protein ENSA5_51520 [Enhygromyxa salina]
MTKVTIQRDICLNMVVPLTATHDFIPLPPFPPVPPPLPAAPLSLAACAIESPVNAWWPPGYALGANKFTTSVFHSGMGICLDGHDCGKFIPHVQVAPAPNNTLTLVHIPLSSRKCNFTASTVKMNGKSTACMLMISWPPSPMTYCSEPMSMPLASAPTAHLNTVTVGMTFGDWFAGAFAIAAGMILEWCLFKYGGGTRDFGQGAGKMIAQSRAGQSIARIIGGNFIGEVKKKFIPWIAGQGVGMLTGAVRIMATGEGSVGVSYEIGGPFLSLKGSAEYSRDNATGEGSWKAGLSGTAGTASGNLDTSGAGISNNHPLGLGSDGVSHDWEKGTTTTSTDVDPFDGFHNTTTTQNPDGTTSVADSQQGSNVSNPL